ncbi:MAG: hypothetical protein WA738_17150 [Candidatus Angelobacter sp.]
MAQTAKIIKAVLVSPSDVQAEWKHVGRAVEDVESILARSRGYALELYHWKTDAYPGWHPEGPQGLIDTVLQIEECDVLIGIFWNRIGTLTQDGTTGTEHEILKAHEASKNHGHPWLMIYFSEAPYSPKTKEETAQKGMVLGFKEKLESKGLLTWPYKSKVEFERQLRRHLSDYLNDRLGALPAQPLQASKEAPAEPTRHSVSERTPLLSVRAGTEVDTQSVSTALAFHPQEASQAEVRRGDLVLVTNTGLDQPGKQRIASNVGVPSLAVNRKAVFFTGNWYAALSSDSGQQFRYIDPNSMAGPSDPPESTFCCNQVVNYIPQIDTFVWVLQYGPATGDNIHRLAFAKTHEMIQGEWHKFDITPRMLQVPGAYLDFSDLAVGTNFLYLTTNLYLNGGTSAGSAVLRIPFSTIESGEVSAEKFVSMDFFSFRMAQNCRETAFFAVHKDTATLSVFSWPENQANPAQTDIQVQRWIGGAGYFSRLPDGRRWLDRADPRLTGATLAGTELWFAWAVDKGSNGLPNPHIQIAKIDSWDMKLIENINVFDPESATCYPALSTNADNDVGISYMIGGGPRFPSHVVGMLTRPRKEILVVNGERGPDPDSSGQFVWGDYLTLRPVFPERKLFAAAAYTLQGKGDDTGLGQDATPHFAVFGRSDGLDLVPIRRESTSLKAQAGQRGKGRRKGLGS